MRRGAMLGGAAPAATRGRHLERHVVHRLVHHSALQRSPVHNVQPCLESVAGVRWVLEVLVLPRYDVVQRGKAQREDDRDRYCDAIRLAIAQHHDACRPHL